MAGKMEPEEAFRLIDHRGVKNRPINPGQTTEVVDAEDKMDGAPAAAPKWLRFTIICVSVILIAGFIGILASGAYLLYDQNDPIPKTDAPNNSPIVFSDTESKELITSTLEKFLNCINTEERLKYVLTPEIERSRMIDYYEKRGNLDVALWKIKLIKPANIEGIQIWMVAYLDVKKNMRYMRFERMGNAFRIQWSSSVGYGELPWDQFAVAQPSEPVQMRCYILRNTGTNPSGFDPLIHYSFIVENQRGEFTKPAIMHRNSEGAHLLDSIPTGSRNPVNLLLKYTDLPNGNRQLVIDKLLHFQWHQHTMTDKGRPVKLR